MELAHHQYLMSTKRRELMRSPQICSNFTWEEKAFADDTSGVLGGIVWPPRFYSCSFCNREFKSAQALGGHMNVHRRDRARLKQSLICVREGGAPDAASPGEVQVLQHIHRQNPNVSSPLQLPIKLKLSTLSRPDENSIDCSHVPPLRYPFISTNHDGIALSIGINNNIAGKRPSGDDARPGFKRHKSETTSMFSCGPCSGDLDHSLQSTTSVKFGNSTEDLDLDLELRLGDTPKVK